ncbi:carbohydrate-binding family 9-like protein [Ursidibacter arcticus]
MVASALIFYLITNSQKNNVYAITKIEDFIISGNGNNPNWNKVEWITLHSTGKQSTLSSKVKMLYSESGLYLLFNNDDHKITATKLEDFSDLWNEDVVEFFLQPNKNIPLYFEYEISPLNKELLILVPNIDGKFQGWQNWRPDKEDQQKVLKTEHKVEVLSNNWIAEVYIPYKLLKPLITRMPSKKDIWYANFYRIDYDEGYKTWFWSIKENNNIDSFHNMENFGKIIFN